MDIEKLIERLKDYRFNWMLDLEVDAGKCTNDCADAATALSTLQTENEKLRAELEQVKRERDEAIKTIFQWVGCPECKWWDSADEWCEKYDREADSCGGCESPEWRGQEE